MNFNHFFNKFQLKCGHVEMMGNVVLISFNSSPSTKLNVSINWSLPSYCINFLTFLSLPQWVPNFWLFFVINARKFSVTRKVGKKCEHVTYYMVPSPNYLHLSSLWLLLAIIVWEGGCGWRESRIMDNMSNSMSKYLIKKILETLHPNVFEKNLQKRKKLELNLFLWISS